MRTPLLVFALVVAACSSVPRPAAGPPPVQPNVVLILADDVGIEGFGAYGGESYRTPNVDRLAASGVRFDHAYALPLCTPSRLQIMTGRYVFRNWRAFGILDPRERTFAQLMKAAGYRTAVVGKWQLFSYDPPEMPAWRGKGTRPEDSEFDEHFVWHGGHTEEKGSRYADPTILDNGRLRPRLAGAYGPDLFADYVDDFLVRHRDRPFFLYYPLVLPHDPFVPTPDDEDWRDPALRHVQDHRDFPDIAVAMNKKAGRAKYFAGMVAHLDKMVGRVIGQLEALGLRGRTLVLFTSDNGTHQAISSRLRGRTVRGGKGLTTDAGIHVPLVVSWPGVVAPGRVSQDLIDSTDLLPTMLEAVGAPRPPDLDGRSFLAQVRGERGEPRAWTFLHHDPRPGADKAHFPREQLALDARYKLHDDGRLYDRAADPDERHPLSPGQGGAQAEAARTKLAAVLARLRPLTASASPRRRPSTARRCRPACRGRAPGRGRSGGRGGPPSRRGSRRA